MNLNRKLSLFALGFMVQINSVLAQSNQQPSGLRPTDALEQFINSPAFYVVIAGLGIAAGIYYMKGDKEETFEPESLDDKVEDRFRDVVSVFGSYKNIQLRYGGFKEIGVIRSGLQYDFKRKIAPEGKEDRPKTDDNVEWKEEEASYHVFITRPRFWKSPAIWFAWYITDVTFGLQIFEKIVNVPTTNIERKDHIYIAEEVNFASFGGVYTDKTERGIEAVQERALIDLLEENTKTFVSLGEHINFLNTQFSQGIQQMREKYKQEREKFHSRSDSAIQ